MNHVVEAFTNDLPLYIAQKIALCCVTIEEIKEIVCDEMYCHACQHMDLVWKCSGKLALQNMAVNRHNELEKEIFIYLANE